MLDTEDSALLHQLFDAAMGDLPWPKALSAMARYFQADDLRLFLDDKAWGQAGVTACPVPQVLVGLRLGRVYNGEELQQRHAGPGAAFLGKDARAIGLARSKGPIWVLIARRKALFRAADAARLSAVAPHLRQAFEIWQRGQGQASCLHQAEGLARRLGLGAVQVDLRQHVATPDPVAQMLLADHDISLGRIIECARACAGVPAVIRLRPGLEMLLDLPDGNPAEGLFLAVLRQTNGVLPPPETLATLLGLTRAEARLAHALGEGNSLTQAAERLGLSVETARNYSKRIFGTTGLRGQTDLMRQLWSGAGLLAR